MADTVTANWVIRTLLACLVAGAILFTFRWLKGGRSRTWRQLWDSLSDSLKRRVRSLVWAALALVVLTIVLPLVELTQEWESLENLLLNIAWVILAAWALVLLSSVSVGFVQWRYDLEAGDNLHARQVLTRVKVLQRIVVVLIWLGGIAGVLLMFERFRVLGGTLLASAGVMSIVLGLSAQKTFGAVIAGIQIALTQPIRLDDVVIVEGEWGRIEEITFTYVVVRVWDQRRLVVPVNYFLEKPFQNWTRQNAELLGTVFLHLDYTAPLDALREELERICREAGDLWDGRACSILVTEAGPETLTVRALVSAADASKVWELRCLVREKLIVFLRETAPHCLPRRRLVMEPQDPQS